jgi:hypothetical protein
MIPLFDKQSAFYEVRRTLLKYLGWRRRRNFSLAMDAALRPLIGKQNAAQTAEDLTGIPPQPWLTIAEAEAEGNRLGVCISRRKLYRLAKKAPPSGDEGLPVRVSADGEWDSVDSPNLSDAKVVIVARISHGAARFQVCSLSQFQGNRDTQHTSLQ